MPPCKINQKSSRWIFIFDSLFRKYSKNDYSYSERSFALMLLWLSVIILDLIVENSKMNIVLISLTFILALSQLPD